MRFKRIKVSTWSLITLLGIAAYVVIDVLLAFLRPHYSLLYNAESDYGRGPYFWVMDINFLLRCAFSLTLVLALLASFPKEKSVRRSCYWLTLWAVTSGLLAFFADNPYGYPKLRSGSVHLLLAFIAFVAVLVAMVSLSRKVSALGFGLVIVRILIALTVVAVLSLVLLGHAGIRPHRPGGLYERVFLGSVLAWEFIVAFSLPRLKTQVSSGVGIPTI